MYSFGIYISSFILKIIALFNTKIKRGVTGREQTFKTLKESIKIAQELASYKIQNIGAIPNDFEFEK